MGLFVVYAVLLLPRPQCYLLGDSEGGQIGVVHMILVAQRLSLP